MRTSIKYVVNTLGQVTQEGGLYIISILIYLILVCYIWYNVDIVLLGISMPYLL